MSSVQEHYDRHLGPVYGWMMGGFEAAKAAAASELRAAECPRAPGGWRSIWARGPVRMRSHWRRQDCCLLEYHETTVTVSDLLHERTDAGWSLRVSGYSKLRIAPEWARSTLHRLGLAATVEAGARAMVRLVAVRPA